MANKNWIAGATRNKGGLHRSLGAPPGQKIPADKMAAAKRGAYGPKAQTQASLANTLKRLDK
jgi:hypothetical protein